MGDEGFVLSRLRAIPLSPALAPAARAEARYELDVENNSLAPRIVYAGELRMTRGAEAMGPRAAFNPTHELALLQPKKRLVIRDIHFEDGDCGDQPTRWPAERPATA